MRFTTSCAKEPGFLSYSNRDKGSSNSACRARGRPSWFPPPIFLCWSQSQLRRPDRFCGSMMHGDRFETVRSRASSVGRICRKRQRGLADSRLLSPTFSQSWYPALGSLSRRSSSRTAFSRRRSRAGRQVAGSSKRITSYPSRVDQGAWRRLRGPGSCGAIGSEGGTART